MPLEALGASLLRPACDARSLGCAGSWDLQELPGFVGQARAVDAMEFGVGMTAEGYNLFLLGPPGVGKRKLAQDYARARASAEPVPPEWCYVNNFEDHRKPRALRLPAGEGIRLAESMNKLVSELSRAIPAVFESDEYRTRSEAIEVDLGEQQRRVMHALQEKAESRNIAMVRTPTGITMVPVKDGETIDPDEFEKLPDEEKRRIREDIKALQEELVQAFRQFPSWQRESGAKLDALNREMAAAVVAQLLEPLRESFAALPDVLDYLGSVERDIVANFQLFIPEGKMNPMQFGMRALLGPEDAAWTNRYRVNVLTPVKPNHGAPVIHEDHPTYNNLMGRIEHRAHQGALFTDFTMIRPGTLHRANGGYLLVDALKVLRQPFAWDALKRALRSHALQLESIGENLGLISTASLEPESIPLDVKVMLFGEPVVYYLLSELDPEFGDLFKVQVDFDDSMPRSQATEREYARLVATLVRRNELPEFDCEALGAVIDYAVRLASDSEKLSMRVGRITDLLKESAYWARATDPGARVGAADVLKAIDKRLYRSDRIRERIHEEIRRGTILIDTEGERVGQVNGLSVMGLGDYSFGRPSRISARTRVGDGQVVDIEREVELGGPIHSKGVMILSSFLGARFAVEQPLSLSASLVFEQSYGGVEGDSASAAELFALLSDLAGAPVRQALAVTGSINQHGEIQAIGGVNEKIEGFFDCCGARGLSAGQGVLIPSSNVKHLMLRPDVAAAAAEGRFHVYAVSTVDEGIELLTGVTAGARDAEGRFPPETINGRVQQRLSEFAACRRDFAGRGPEAENG